MENKPNLSIFTLICIAILIDIILALLFWAITFPLYYWINDMALLWKVLTILLLGSVILTGIRIFCLWGQHRFFEYVLRLGESRGETVFKKSGIVFTVNAIIFLLVLWMYAFKKDAEMIILLLILTATIGFVNSIFKFPNNV